MIMATCTDSVLRTTIISFKIKTYHVNINGTGHVHFRRKSSKNQEKSEVSHLNGIDYFDPFLERNLEHPTT